MYREQLLLSYYAYEPGGLKRGKSSQCVQIQALSLFEALPIDNNHVTRCAFRLFLQVWWACTNPRLCVGIQHWFLWLGECLLTKDYDVMLAWIDM